ncbi:hypothetical protein [Cytobacillus sp. IB215316]|uniref:hypothetical protein n=1 Tax=Cytobacillus sp. IB215316 TaxID=3097354 RepID=UPI002A1099C8|nr:hypothetical protein [Cytobacillus sp. IB215316]MDX8363311.1 hypothetical protein [Cytobacillus sp. IB215316]
MRINTLLFVIIVFSSFWITGSSNEMFKDTEGRGEEFPPSMSGKININETDYEMLVGNYKWERKQGLYTQVVQTDAISPYQIADNFESVRVEPNDKINIQIEGNPQITVYLWNENGREMEVMLNDKQVLIPNSKGHNIYEVLAKWPDGELSYTFVLEVR